MQRLVILVYVILFEILLAVDLGMGVDVDKLIFFL